jgi:hypothetical protein
MFISYYLSLPSECIPWTTVAVFSGTVSLELGTCSGVVRRLPVIVAVLCD